MSSHCRPTEKNDGSKGICCLNILPKPLKRFSAGMAKILLASWAMKGAKGLSDLASAAQHARDYFDSYANEEGRLLSG